MTPVPLRVPAANWTNAHTRTLAHARASGVSTRNEGKHGFHPQVHLSLPCTALRRFPFVARQEENWQHGSWRRMLIEKNGFIRRDRFARFYCASTLRSSFLLLCCLALVNTRCSLKTTSGSWLDFVRVGLDVSMRSFIRS